MQARLSLAAGHVPLVGAAAGAAGGAACAASPAREQAWGGSAGFRPAARALHKHEQASWAAPWATHCECSGAPSVRPARAARAAGSPPRELASRLGLPRRACIRPARLCTHARLRCSRPQWLCGVQGGGLVQRRAADLNWAPWRSRQEPARRRPTGGKQAACKSVAGWRCERAVASLMLHGCCQGRQGEAWSQCFSTASPARCACGARRRKGGASQAAALQPTPARLHTKLPRPRLAHHATPTHRVVHSEDVRHPAVQQAAAAVAASAVAAWPLGGATAAVDHDAVAAAAAAAVAAASCLARKEAHFRHGGCAQARRGQEGGQWRARVCGWAATARSQQMRPRALHTASQGQHSCGLSPPPAHCWRWRCCGSWWAATAAGRAGSTAGEGGVAGVAGTAVQGLQQQQRGTAELKAGFLSGQTQQPLASPPASPPASHLQLQHRRTPTSHRHTPDRTLMAMPCPTTTPGASGVTRGSTSPRMYAVMRCSTSCWLSPPGGWKCQPRPQGSAAKAEVSSGV